MGSGFLLGRFLVPSFRFQVGKMIPTEVGTPAALFGSLGVEDGVGCLGGVVEGGFERDEWIRRLMMRMGCLTAAAL